MAPSVSSPRMVITEEDLHVIATATLMRFSTPEEEEYRLERVRQFLSEAAELGRVLHVHTNCAMVNHRGTFGAHDLRASTSELFTAFEDYATLLRVLATEFRHLLFGDAENQDDVLTAGRIERSTGPRPLTAALPQPVSS
jgi:hypothetical protein